MRKLCTYGILAIVALPGCIGIDTPSEPAAIQIGTWATYEGSDGTTVRLEIIAEDVLFDGHMRAHDVVVVRYDVTPALTGATHTFFEAVERGTGLNVQWWWYCDREASDRNHDLRCYDGATTVYTSGSGLPGLFGFGPVAMAASVPAADGSLKIFPQGGPAQTATLTTAPSKMAPGCQDLQWLLPDDATSMGFQPVLQVFEGALRGCPGVKLPVLVEPSWQVPAGWGPKGGVHFTMISHGRTADEKPLSLPGGREQAAWTDVALLTPKAHQSPVYLYASGPEEPAPIKDAHRFAQEADEGYRRVAESAWFMVAESTIIGHGSGPYFDLLHDSRYESYERAIGIVDSKGDGVRVGVEVTYVYRNGELHNTTWELTGSTEMSVPTAVQAMALGKYVEPNEFYDLAGRLTPDGDSRSFGFSHRARHSDIAGPFEVATAGPVLTQYAVWPSRESAGSVPTLPVYVNGLTGSLLGLRVLDERMPFGPAGGLKRPDTSA